MFSGWLNLFDPFEYQHAFILLCIFSIYRFRILLSALNVFEVVKTISRNFVFNQIFKDITRFAQLSSRVFAQLRIFSTERKNADAEVRNQILPLKQANVISFEIPGQTTGGYISLRRFWNILLSCLHGNQKLLPINSLEQNMPAVLGPDSSNGRAILVRCPELEFRRETFIHQLEKCLMNGPERNYFSYGSQYREKIRYFSSHGSSFMLLYDYLFYRTTWIHKNFCFQA